MSLNTLFKITAYTGNSIWSDHVIFRNIYMYICLHMHAITINIRKGHGFERGAGRNILEYLEGKKGRRNVIIV